MQQLVRTADQVGLADESDEASNGMDAAEGQALFKLSCGKALGLVSILTTAPESRN